ncbi:hypothetical protein ACVINI_006423 [Rhizobium beringeri]
MKAWAVVEIERLADLLDAAGAHDDNLVGHGHRLDLVVGDVNDGRAKALMQLLDLATHGHPQLGVEVGQWLVKEEHFRMAYDGAAHGDALALAAGKLFRQALQQGFKCENTGGFAHQLVDCRLIAPLQLQGKAHIFAHRHVRIECVGLEHHGDIALLRRDVVDDAAVDADFTAADIL